MSTEKFSAQKLGPMFYLLVASSAISVLAEIIHAPAVWSFFVACACIVALAAFLGNATEVVSHRVGSNVGAFLNATFGNATELILGIIGINAGLFPVIKDSIAGGVFANLLLVGGCAALFGGLMMQKRTRDNDIPSGELDFNQTGAQAGVTILWVALILISMPTFASANFPNLVPMEKSISMAVAFIALAVYLCYLLFSQRTHSYVYADDAQEGEQHDDPGFGWRTSVWVAILAIIAVGVGFESEFLMGSLEPAAEALGLPTIFVSFCIVAFLGGVAEHWSGVTAAINGNMTLSNGIFVGSSIQLLICVLPIFVIYGTLTGRADITLVFEPIVIWPVVLAVLLWDKVSNDGRVNWLEGALSVILCFATWALIYLYGIN
jgi:Ca2+:H+ antiporter